jgi:hypothetical protein
VHDAITAEKLGIPAVAVVTQRFLPTGRVMADFLGLHDYPVACIAHPISNNTELEISAKAEEVVWQGLTLLESPLRAIQ